MVAAKPDTPLPPALLGGNSGVLLVVAAAEETAKRIESSLRNNGHPLRAMWVVDLEDLEEALRRDPPDLVLCDEHLAAAPQPRVLALCAELRPDLPVILLCQRHSLERSVTALAAGAADLCAYSEATELQHLEGVVIREFGKHQHFRNLRLAQQRLADFQSRQQQRAAGTGEALAEIREGILAEINPGFAHLLGFDDAAELVGQPLIDLIAAEQRAVVKERLRQVLKGKHNGESLELAFCGQRGNVRARTQFILGGQGEERAIELVIRSEGGKGRPASLHSALHDRCAFVEALGVAPAAGAVGGALLARVDHFEALEQRIGYAEAQEITARIAEAIHAKLEVRDQSFAFSAGELALTVQRANYAEIQQFAEFLLKEIGSRIFATLQHEAQVRLSIAVYALDGDEPADMVLRELVGEARKLSAQGGNRVALLGATAQAHLSEREAERKAALVREALEDDRLKLAYQSIASLEGESRGYFDVLLRLIDADGREWHAAEFVPAAVKAGLMPVVDRWVTTRTLATIAKRGASSDAAVLFVRLSEATLKDTAGFIAWLRTQLGGISLKQNEIVFQLGETLLQNHISKAKLLARGLRELGAGLAIEHYGLSANSMPLLDHIPAAFIKFHASFTQKLDDKDVCKRLADLVEAARHRSLKTIVSHVEDARVMARLWQMGVNFVQGYHIQEPEVVLLASEVAPR